MNAYRCAVYILAYCCITYGKQEPLELTIHKAWKSLDDTAINHETYGGNLILGGTIEVIKRSHEPVFITKILLKWRGKKLDSLIGSLYKQPIDKEFLPIEEFLLCDGSWNTQDQYLIFTFTNPVLLQARTTLQLVFMIPPALESCIKSGSFEIEPFSVAKSFHDLVPATGHKLAYTR
jgi:hypothetical protein